MLIASNFELIAQVLSPFDDLAVVQPACQQWFAPFNILSTYCAERLNLANLDRSSAGINKTARLTEIARLIGLKIEKRGAIQHGDRPLC